VQTGKAKRLVLSGCVYLPTGPCQATGFILSPNRKYAAVVVEIDCGDPHTCSYALDLVKVARGQEPRVVATEEDSLPLAFSPDDRQLVFRSHLGLMAVRLAGGEPVPLAQSGLPGASLVPSDVTQVQWSPDGRWVTYIENDFSADDQRLEVVATTGTSAPRDLATCSIGDLRFSWSPTSRLVAYDCTDQKGGFMTVRPDGTHLVNLLKGRKLVYAGYAPQWSPDDSRLLFVAGAFPFAGHVWTVRPNGRDLTRRS
jgi:Tol biopolymer transport system component